MFKTMFIDTNIFDFNFCLSEPYFTETKNSPFLFGGGDVDTLHGKLK